MLKAVVFDLDNTLYDRNATAERYFGILYDRYAVDPPIDRAEAVKRTMALDASGYGNRPEMRRIMREEWHYAATDEQIIGDWEGCIPSCFVPFPGAREMLIRLRERGLLLGVVTNGYGSVQRTKLRVGGFDGLFDDVVISREVGLSKPDPAIFQLSTTHLGVRPRDAVYVGDYFPNDVIGALKAGMSVIWYGGRGPVPAGAPTVPMVPSIPDLENRLLSL
ncbi:MAG: HAD family hydrolase [Eubacteriales bacterium]|nr:HAD family hydrolase [Eubacteriales bacterium]